MSGQHVGYVRVSTVDQNTARQLEGVKLDKVFEEKASAKDMDRPQLQAALDYVREGDTLHVHSIDRLCRNLRDCQQLVDDLTGRGVAVAFHKENLTFNGHNDAMQRLMLQMMGAFAEFERTLIRERQAEGIAKAKAAGRYKGRKQSLSGDDVKSIRDRLAGGESKAALAREFGVSRQTIYSSLQR